MTTRYDCPLSTCSWFHKSAASAGTFPLPADVLSWSALNWSYAAELINSSLTAVQVIDAHLATHSPVQWMAELNRERRLRQAAEAERDRASWMPSRAEVEASDLWRPAVAVNMTGGADA